MTNKQLIAQHKRCIRWNDPDQWDALAIAYHRRGYIDNAARCFRKADELRRCSFAEALPASVREMAVRG
jgi:Flp pilus assembly protein TadD